MEETFEFGDEVVEDGVSGAVFGGSGEEATAEAVGGEDELGGEFVVLHGESRHVSGLEIARTLKEYVPACSPGTTSLQQSSSS